MGHLQPAGTFPVLVSFKLQHNLNHVQRNMSAQRVLSLIYPAYGVCARGYRLRNETWEATLSLIFNEEIKFSLT